MRSGFAAFASLDLMLKVGVALEVRTTVHSALTPPEMLLKLARERRIFYYYDTVEASAGTSERCLPTA